LAHDEVRFHGREGLTDPVNVEVGFRQLIASSRRARSASTRPLRTQATDTPSPSASPPRDPDLRPTGDIPPARRAAVAAH
jgi:hypothetical protein